MPTQMGIFYLTNVAKYIDQDYTVHNQLRGNTQ